MKVCPECTTGYPNGQTSCPTHGTLLNEIRELKSGMIIHKTYRIIGNLAKVEWGAATLPNTLMDEPRALKFLPPELSADQDFTSRFLREMRTLWQVRNLNVVDRDDIESSEHYSRFLPWSLWMDPPSEAFFATHLSPSM